MHENLSVGAAAAAKKALLSGAGGDRVSVPPLEYEKAGEWDLALRRREAMEDDMEEVWSRYT